MNALTATGLHKRYASHHALRGLDMEIPHGSLFGLLGPNGAGKTTFIRIANRILAPDEGEILLFGQPLGPETARRIGYLPEERGLYKSMKVGEQAMYLAQLRGLSATDAKQRLRSWFERWELQSWWDKKVSDLSKGMAQKVQFITTVLHEPELLIFDEPFSGFDPINAQLIREEMLRLNREGRTIIFSTHRMESVEELCSHIALVNQGQNVLHGSIQELKDRHRSGQFVLRYRSADVKDVVLPEGVELTDHRREAEGIVVAQFRGGIDDASRLLTALAPHVNVYQFEEVVPSIHDLFVQTVQGS
ncbi:MAG: ABC transporter ATP-binding protein [Bacteroidetes bacterium]|nr:ABC transporter ATP-binding protein [Bacteroidota bacterium]